MAEHPAHILLHHLRRLAAKGQAQALSDQELLERFIACRDEAAFAELVKRHGPVVLSVCRSVLRHQQDAEDAFQATFLVLARKAASTRRPAVVGSWLHGVAYRLAHKARQQAVRRRQHERQTAERTPAATVMDDWTWGELRAVLHEEIERLPEKYRLPLLLCYWEGLTQEEAARRAGWTKASLRERLERAREMLRSRLVRRGLATAVPLLAVGLSPGAMSASLVETTMQNALLFAVGGSLSGPTVALANGGIQAMGLLKLKIAAALVLMFSVVAAGAGYTAYQQFKEPSQQKQEELPQTPPSVHAPHKTEAETKLQTDRFGDPLPARAVARIGTVRWWHGRDNDCPLIFTPDGKSLISYDWLKGIRFVDTVTGKELRRIEFGDGDFDSQLFYFALSPDGKTLVTASRKPELRVWDVSTGKELRQLAGNPRGNTAIVFSQDGKTFAAAVSDKIVQLWDVATWQESHQVQAGWSHSLQILPDGKTLVNAGDGISWWDIATGKQIRRMPWQLALQYRLALSPDGKKLAAVVQPGTLYLWEAASGKEISQTMLSKQGSVWCLGFSPDSRILACCESAGHRDKRATLFFDAETGRELRRWDEEGWTHALAFSPDGKTLACLKDHRIQIRDAATGQPALPTIGLPDYAMSVKFTPDGKALLAGCQNGQIGYWDPLSGKELKPLLGPPDDFAGRPRMLLGAALTADCSKAALVDIKDVLYVWEPTTGKLLCRINKPPVGTDQVDFSLDGKLLMVKHKDQNIRIWDAATGKMLCALPRFGATRLPHPHVFSPDGHLLAIAPGSMDRSVIRLWDMAKEEVTGELAWLDKTIPMSMTFSPDGKSLVAAHGGFDTGVEMDIDLLTLRHWDLATGRELRRFKVRSNDIRSLVISPDGKTLAVADHDTVVLWELASGQERGRFAGHRDWIWSLAFSPDGRLLASGCQDYTALVWDMTGICPDGKWSLRDVPPEEFERLWTDLASAEGVRAYRAMWAMAAARQAVSFLAERLRPVAPIEDERVTRLIAQLDSEQFEIRTQAEKELRQLSELAEPALRKALAGRPSLEARRRLEALLDQVESRTLTPEQLHFLRAVEVLEHSGTPEAKRVLERLAKGAPEARLTSEARASLKRLSKQP